MDLFINYLDTKFEKYVDRVLYFSHLINFVIVCIFRPALVYCSSNTCCVFRSALECCSSYTLISYHNNFVKVLITPVSETHCGYTSLHQYVITITSCYSIQTYSVLLVLNIRESGDMYFTAIRLINMKLILRTP